MASEIEIILTKAGEHLSTELKDDIVNLSVTPFGPVNASGDLAASIRFEAKDGNLKVFANSYIYQIQNGRKPGKKPPRAAIEKWIEDKGIVLQNISKESLAFLIQRKIGEEGTTIYQQGGTKFIQDAVGPTFRGAFQSEIYLAFKRQAVLGIKNALTIKNG